MIQPNRGFTLIELVTVMVIVGIVASIGTQFVVTAVESYQINVSRAKLVARSRQALERIVRQITIAVPNSVRVTNSGNCVEFLPIAGGGTYLGLVPDTENNVAGINQLTTGGYSINFGTGRYVLIGALSSAEIYSGSSQVLASLVAPLASGSSGSNLNFANRTVFLRNSVNRRVFIADNPQAFCLAGTELRFYENYSTPATSNGIPGVPGTLMAADVRAGAAPFLLAPGTEDRNTVLNITLHFTASNEELELNRQVYIRNVP